MCGRFVSKFSAAAWQELQNFFAIERAVIPAARFNIAPTQAIAGLMRPPAKSGATAAQANFRFGMSAGSRLVINARAETLTERPMFRHLLHKNRVLILATGFYEWAPPSAERKTKQPIYYSWPQDEVFCFAALAQATSNDNAGAVIITTEANEVVRPSHARMPVILGLAEGRKWLAEETEVDEALSLLCPFSDELHQWPVGLQVNVARHDATDCIEPLAAHGEAQLSIF